MCAHLKARYPDVDTAVIRRDVNELLADLADFGLVAPNHFTPHPEASRS
jgi:hypothetical protein